MILMSRQKLPIVLITDRRYGTTFVPSFSERPSATEGHLEKERFTLMETNFKYRQSEGVNLRGTAPADFTKAVGSFNSKEFIHEKDTTDGRNPCGIDRRKCDHSCCNGSTARGLDYSL